MKILGIFKENFYVFHKMQNQKMIYKMDIVIILTI